MSWVITKKFIYIVTIAILFCSVVIYLWSGRPVEIVDVHYYSGKDINILARHFPITDRGKLNWWRENERKILEKYNLPKNDFSVYIWDFGDGYQKLSPYDAEDEFYCFPDIKSESKCIKKIYICLLNLVVIIIGCFYFLVLVIFINRKKMMISLSNQITPPSSTRIKAMKKITIISLFLILPLKANIIPSISLPDKLSESKYSVRMLRIDARIDYRVETPECKNVKFNDYFFLNENIKDLNDKNHVYDPEFYPITLWSCSYSREVYDVGEYGSHIQHIVFDKNKNIWVIDDDATKTNNEFKPSFLYNISSVNAQGFLIIDENISEMDKTIYEDDNIKKKFYFCMIDGSHALCGAGSLIRKIDNQLIDFTPYILKSLESMEIGVN
ncbi:DUF943 family protein [Salmonella enterica subsp. enterica serovar Paratyphi A]